MSFMGMRRGMFRLYKEKNSKFLYSMYVMMSETPIVKYYFKRLKTRLKLLYPNDAYTVNRMTVRIVLKGVLTIIPCMVAAIAFFKGELFYIAAAVLTLIIIFLNNVDSSVSRLEYKLLYEFKGFLDDIRHYYHETGMLDDTLFMAMDSPDVSHELRLHINCFYEIVTSVDMVSEIEKYSATIAPNRFFLMFLSTCVSVNEYGDSRVNGQSVFLKNLNYLKDSVSDELLKLELIKALFSGLVFVCMLPVFLLKPIAAWGISVFPEMSRFYEGLSGTVFAAFIYAVTIIVYAVILSMQSNGMGKEADGVIWDKLLENSIIKRFAVLHDNYNASLTEKIGDMLKATGSRPGTQKFFLKRLVIAFLVFVAINLMTISSINHTAERLISDFSNDFTSAFIPGEDYRQMMQKIAKDYAKKSKGDLADEDELRDKIVSETGIDKEYAMMVAEAVNAHISDAAGYGYRWYVFAAALLCAFIGYYVPYVLLVYKNGRAYMEQQGEIEQFQTIALILMNMDGVTINTILEWLLRFSFCFREDIERCLLELEKSEEDALLDLRNNDYKPFKHFTDCLIAIDKVGVKLAFAPIEEERVYNKEKRRQDNRYMLERKSRLCKTIAFIPLYVTIFGYLIIPFAITAINMFSEFTIF